MSDKKRTLYSLTLDCAYYTTFALQAWLQVRESTRVKKTTVVSVLFYSPSTNNQRRSLEHWFGSVSVNNDGDDRFTARNAAPSFEEEASRARLRTIRSNDVSFEQFRVSGSLHRRVDRCGDRKDVRGGRVDSNGKGLSPTHRPRRSGQPTVRRDPSRPRPRTYESRNLRKNRPEKT